MSRCERIKGILVEVKNEKKLPLEDLCKEICNANSYEIEDYYDSWEECLDCEGDEKYIILNGKVFEIQDYKELDIYGDYCHIRKLNDGSYAFETQFYNGGTYLREMLENHFDEVQDE